MSRLFLVGCYFHWDWQAYWIWVSPDHVYSVNYADMIVGILAMVRRSLDLPRSYGRRQQAMVGEI